MRVTCTRSLCNASAVRVPPAGYLYSLPYVRECIVDILLGSPESEVRQVMADQLLQLSQLSAPEVSPSPRDFLTQVSRGAESVHSVSC